MCQMLGSFSETIDADIVERKANSAGIVYQKSQSIINENNTSEERQKELALSDNTKIGDTVWAILKQFTMKKDYKSQTWFSTLTNQDKALLE